MIVYLIGGLVFGFGLALSGMVKPEVVLSFLQLDDLGLLLVMGGAVAVSALAFWLIPKFKNEPLQGGKWEPKNPKMGKNVWTGSIIFGLGWGLSGLCPGSALAGIGVGNYPVLLGILGMFIGAFFEGKYFEK